MADRLTVFILCGVLAEIPYISVYVLRMPIEGKFDQFAVNPLPTLQDNTGDTHYLFGVMSHIVFDMLGAVFSLSLIDVCGSRCQREVGVGHRADKVRGVNVHLIRLLRAGCNCHQHYQNGNQEEYS